MGVLYLGQLFKEAGFPPGVVNLISGAAKVGALMASHMDIAKISFTGSANAGRQIQIAAAKSNLKRVSLELGGKSPVLIFDDANLENAVVHNSQGFLLNSGQACVAGSRILVQRGIAPKFIDALRAAYIEFSQSMADPALESTFLGPLADKSQFGRVMDFLEGAKKDGVEVLVGGGRKGKEGCFVEPTILMNPDLTAKVYTDEIFGPVVVIKTFENEEEAIALANNTSYGLGGEFLHSYQKPASAYTELLATIYTNDITRALRVTAEMESGTVSINSSHVLLTETPFGGKKQSGYGREGGLEGLKEYLEAKTVHVNMRMVGS